MFRRIRAALFGLLGIAMLLGIVQYLPLPRHTYLWDRTFDTGHIIIFGFATVLLLLVARAVFGSKRIALQYASAMILSASLGLLLEIWQRNHGRDAEWIDLFNDIAGVISFAAIVAVFDSALPDPRSGFWRRGWLIACAALVMVIAAIPFLQVVNLYRVRGEIVPRLIDFKQPWDHRFFYAQTSQFAVVSPPADWPDSSTKPTLVGRVDAKPGKYPGFIMKEAYPDWSGYEYFDWDVYLEDDSSRVFTIRAHDQHHDMRGDYRDRFGRDINLHPGFQTIRIATEDIRTSPRDREMDLKRMAGFAIFTSDLECEVRFYVGEATLK